MMRRLTVFAAVALLGIASCGDDSTSSATTTGTEAASTVTEPVENTVIDETVVDETVVDETVVDETVVDDSTMDDTVVGDTFPDDTADPNAPGIGSEFCDVSDELHKTNFDPFSATPEDLEEFLTVGFPDMFSRLVASAPAELKDDVATVGAAYEVLTTELENNEWDMSAAFTNPTVQETMTSEALSTAGGNLDTYCGL